MVIASLANPRVKAAVKLRDRQGRDEQGRIVIDGTREIGRALDGGVKIALLFVCEELLDAEQHDLVQRALASGGERLDVTRPVMEKLAFGQRVEGLVAVAETPHRSLSDVGQVFNLSPTGPGQVENLSYAPLIAVLEGVEKPGNVGAVLRTADAVGVSALIVADGGTDLFNPNAIRASLGAIFTLPVCAASSAETLAWLRDHPMQIVAARTDGSTPYTKIDFRSPTAIVLGTEAHGLSPLWQGDDITAISLPLLGHVDSLNVSAAAAVLFYEALRQRR
ncbi:MAG TPA: RNA methyltransferase [Pirellulaceae bacterium]|nr:RNA methyltransferase [Pirellulaceae bacterium]